MEEKRKKRKMKGKLEMIKKIIEYKIERKSRKITGVKKVIEKIGE